MINLTCDGRSLKIGESVLEKTIVTVTGSRTVCEASSRMRQCGVSFGSCIDHTVVTSVNVQLGRESVVFTRARLSD